MGFQRTLPDLTEAAELAVRIDQQIVQLNRIFFQLLTEVMHHPKFQALEAKWRGLRYLVDNAGDTGLVETLLLSVSKEDMFLDYQAANELSQSGIFHQIYTQEYDTPGGHPYAAVLIDEEFDRSAGDLNLLEHFSKVGKAAHAPFITSVGPSFFGLNDWGELPGISDLSSIFQTAEYIKWNSFRKKNWSRYLVLSLNRFLIRVPHRGYRFSLKGAFSHSKETRLLTYDETRWGSPKKSYIFANPAYAIGAVLIRSFIRTGWCLDIVGIHEEEENVITGGTIERTPKDWFDYGLGAGQKISTECLFTDQLERRVAEEGFLAIGHHQALGLPIILSARTVQNSFSTAGQQGCFVSRLPFVLLISRLAHYVKFHQRQNLGSMKERQALQEELESWLKKLVTTSPSFSSENRYRYPLKEAKVEVRQMEDNPGYFAVDLQVYPHHPLEQVDIELRCEMALTAAPDQKEKENN